jgi:hypothetical protein
MNCGRRHDVWLPLGRYLDYGTLALFGLLFKRGQRIAMPPVATATGTGRVAHAARDGYTVVASGLLRLERSPGGTCTTGNRRLSTAHADCGSFSPLFEPSELM